MSELIPINRSIAPSFNYGNFSLPENASLTFHLNPHKTAGDLPEPAELGSMIRSTDIIIAEFVHSHETKDMLAKISAGRQKDYDEFRMRGKDNEAFDWIRAMISGLYASRTATANIDVDINNPSIKAFFATENSMHRGTAMEIRSNFDEVRDNVLSNFSAIKARDQQILENLTPEIEKVVAENRKLSLKRADQPLDIRIFYGTGHRSLLDAVLVKSNESPAIGFSAQDSPDSIKNDLMPTAYGKYLRGQNVEIEDIERMFAYSAFGAFVHNKRYLGNNPSGRLLTTAFLDLEDQLDTTDFVHLLDQVKTIYEK